VAERSGGWAAQADNEDANVRSVGRRSCAICEICKAIAKKGAENSSGAPLTTVSVTPCQERLSGTKGPRNQT